MKEKKKQKSSSSYPISNKLSLDSQVKKSTPSYVRYTKKATKVKNTSNTQQNITGKKSQNNKKHLILHLSHWLLAKVDHLAKEITISIRILCIFTHLTTKTVWDWCLPEALNLVWLSRNWDPENQPKPPSRKQTGGLL